MNGRAVPWVIAGAAGGALVAVLLIQRGPARHPDPRPGITAMAVLPLPAVPPALGASQAYAAARSAPGVLDGLYCYCHCREEFNHRSLLTCFESEHAASCDLCMGEAVLAVNMASQGSTLEQIRRAIDERFGGS